MGSPKKNYKVPFDKDGNLYHIPGPTDFVDWRTNESFTNEVFEIVGHIYGRTALRFLWKNIKTNKTYPMFAIDMVALVKSNYPLINGRTPTYAWWKVVKRGTHYGLMAIYDV